MFFYFLFLGYLDGRGEAVLVLAEVNGVDVDTWNHVGPWGIGDSYTSLELVTFYYGDSDMKLEINF